MKNKTINGIVNKLFLFAFITLLSTSCKKQKEELAIFDNNIETQLTTKIGETLILKPTVVGNVTSYEWIENSKVISNEPVYSFKKTEMGDYSIVLNVSNSAGVSSLTYKVKVIGPYTNGILLINGTNNDGTGGGNISYLDEKENLTLDVFSKENNAKLSMSSFRAFVSGNDLYVSSANGPNYVALLDRHTLKLQSNITTSGIASNLYDIATTDGRTGYIISTLRRKVGLYPIDFTTKSISGTIVPGTTDMPRVPLTIVNDSYIMPVGKQLLKLVNGGTVQTLFTATENVAGIIKKANNQTWIGVSKGGSPKAKFVRVDDNFVAQETVELDAEIALPANGVLTYSANDEFIYWQETSLGDFYRFNTTTKKAELVVAGQPAVILFPTAWKVHPKTGEFYIFDTPGTLSGGDTNTDLYIYGKDKVLRKKITKVGYQVSDVIFPK